MKLSKEVLSAYNPPRESWESEEHAKYYLLGVYLSDGHLTRRGRFVLVVRDKSFQDTTAKALDLLKIKHSCTKYKVLGGRFIPQTGYTTKAGARFEARILSSLEGNTLSKWMTDFTESKEHLPYISPQFLAEVLAGVLDGDGGVHIRTHRIIVSGIKGYLPELIDQLKAQGIHIRGPRTPRSRPKLKRYNFKFTRFVLAGLYFRMPRKQILIDDWVVSRLQRF